MNSDSKSQGLVICSKSVRLGIQPKPPVSWQTRRVAAMFPKLDPNDKSNQGERIYLSINPGILKISRTNTDRKVGEKSPTPRKPIQKWTPKSRANMVARFSSLDYSSMFEKDKPIPVMITLTYPGDWLVVAPSAKASKAHLTSFRKRFERRFGIKLQALWRAEFQRRGAVHFHLFCVAPIPVNEFRDWVAETWVSIVNHPDPEQKRRHRVAGTAVDISLGATQDSPHRIAVYFSKHSSPNIGAKEYQNQPPQEWIESGSVGRFWGYWNLSFTSENVRLSREDALLASRILRRWFKSKRIYSKVAVFRVNQETGVVKKRTANRKLKRFPSMSAFLVVNDGVGIAKDLAQVIARKNTPFREAPLSQEPRGVLCPQSSESATSKVPQNTDATSKKNNNSRFKVGQAWAAFGSWLKRLRGLKKNS